MPPPQLQADVAAIPANSIALLGSLKPLLKILSADNVQALAVFQIQDIGSLFHVNGPFAEQLPNYLTRRTSARLERLELLMGWERDDTASLMAQTPGGRAAALLCLMIEETLPGDAVGDVLYQLAGELLPLDKRNCSIAQLRDVSRVLAAKLRGIGFGTHLAKQVTRIREAYLYMNEREPRDLLDIESTETMVQLLRCLHFALIDENSGMRYEGTTGAGYAAAFFTALCPEDTLIIVEGEIIYAGARQSIILDIGRRDDQSRVFNFTSLRQRNQELPSFLIPNSERELGFSPTYSCVKWKGWLSIKLDFMFSEFAIICTPGIKQAFCTLIASMAATKRVHPKMASYSYDPGIMLGQYPLIRIRSSLRDSTGFEPNPLSPSNAFTHLVSEIALAVSTAPWPICDAEIPCGFRWERGVDVMYFFDAIERNLFHSTRCALCEGRDNHGIELVSQLIVLIRSGFASLFISPYMAQPPYSFDKSNIIVPLGVPIDDGDCRHGATNIFHKIKYLITGDCKLPQRPFGSIEEIGPSLFDWIFQIFHAPGNSCAEICQSGTLFSGNLVEPQFNLQNGMTFYVFDGVLHDGKGNTVLNLRSESINYCAWEGWGPALEWERGSRKISDQGVHKYGSMKLTYFRWAGESESLVLSCDFQWKSRIVEFDFITLLRQYVAVTLAEPCQHQLSEPLTDDKTAFPTSVGAPYGPSDPKWRCIEALAALESYEIPITMTNGNPIAQFLCLSCPPRFNLPNNPRQIMHQGAACINCAWDQARALRCTMIIGS
ncbi:hypothetical protein H072_5100 [Dactylellina haptotyla CBS 200.50]|uniref:Uncharacterized protein n=1 Tax=Dactylellina haptotyla (strain CBS 200.50) TaxID=1284197 RepID=S8ADD5_DACHA|nr:hypothetical protein H072_5100 [Dactylellina haptotyla CBS 200.50]